jgi:hypothetical protein
MGLHRQTSRLTVALLEVVSGETLLSTTAGERGT